MTGGKETGIVLRNSLTCSLLTLALAAHLSAAQRALATAESHVEAAQIAQHHQDYKTAEQEYRAALVLEPGYAEVHMNLGLTYQMQGRTAEAIPELRRAIDLKPKLAGANLMLGIDLCKLGQGANALRYLAEAVALDPRRMEAYAWLATAEEITGNYPAELQTIEQALKLYPEDVDLSYLEGHTYELLGGEQALAIKAAAPNQALSEQLLAESYATSAEWPSAVVHFKNAIALSSHHPALHVELGEVFLRAGKLDNAIGAFNEELTMDPVSVRAIVRRGEAELLEMSQERALADWSHALTLDAQYTYHLLGLDGTLSQFSAADMPGAIEQLNTEAPELSLVGSPASRLALAYIVRQQHSTLDGSQPQMPASYSASRAPRAPGNSDTSCTAPALRRSIAAGRISEVGRCKSRLPYAQVSDSFRMTIALSLLELGDYQSCLEELAGSKLHPSGSAELNYLRARCYEALSAAAYLKLYRTHPNSVRVHQLMGDLAAARGDDRKAMEEYRAAIALQPDTPNLHYSLAHVLWKNSDVGAARVEYDAELAITPAHTGALHDLGQTYLMEHQPEKALYLLQQAAAAGAKGPALDRDLGTAYSELGQYRLAEEKYTLALAADHDGSIHFKLAHVYRALGEKEKALHESALAADLNRKYHGRIEEQTPQLKSVDE